MTDTINKRLEDMLEVFGKATAPDCGDNSCLYKAMRGGMRTNGGCRCRGSDPYFQKLHKSRTDWEKSVRALREAVDTLQLIAEPSTEVGFVLQTDQQEALSTLKRIEEILK